jgi:cobalt-zinc-cadmium efflux system outer membrane protein
MLVIGLPGCASVPKEAGFDQIQKIGLARTGQLVQWRGHSAADAAVDRALDTLLQKPLAVDDAVQIALLSNHHLQASYEELGVAQADLVQAGLLSNPVLTVERRFPGQATDIGITQNFLDLLLLSSRKKMANDQFDATRLRIAHQVLSLAADVKIAYWKLKAQQQVVRELEKIVQLNRTAADLARRQENAGAANELSAVNQEIQSRQSEIELSRARVQLSTDRQNLARLMGVRRADWKIAPGFPEVPTGELSLEGLETQALSQRLDLQAAQKDIDATARNLGLAKTVRYIPLLTIGGRYVHEIDPEHSIGPTIEVGIPLFDQGQATLSRENALLAQAQQQYAALAVDIVSEVRQASEQTSTLRDLLQTYESLLPQQQRAIALTLQHYNGMLKGPYDLLLAKQNELTSEQGYVEAQRDFWIARAELERALGGKIPAIPGSTTRPAATTAPATEPLESHPTEMQEHAHDHSP